MTFGFSSFPAADMPRFGPQTLRPGCKINLYLRILGRYTRDCAGRRKGMHALDTVFLPLDAPCDELTLHSGASGTGLRVRCDAPEVDPERNTLTLAWELYAAAGGFRPDLDVRLVKGIPAGAGLGGGSSDAAALLLWLEARAPAPLGAARLAEIAAQVGADVPFFLLNRPCRALGIGDVLEPWSAAGLAGLGLVLVCPPVHVSTPEAYAAWDRLHPDKNADCVGTALTTADPGATDSAFRTLRGRLVFPDPANDFEEVVFRMYPESAEIKQDLIRAGALGAALSGSGAALFGFFAAPEQADRVARSFRERGLDAWSRVVPEYGRNPTEA